MGQKREREKFFNHLLKIFDLANVTEDELHILANLSVLPPIYIPIPDVSEWLKLKTKEDINSLVFKGWLKQQGFNILMHQVIQEITRYKTSPDVEKCKSLILSLTYKLNVDPGENPIHKKKYIIFAETFLHHIDENIEELATLSNNVSSIHLFMGSLEKALEFQLKASNIWEEVLDKNRPLLARSYNNLALIYLDLKDYESACKYGEKAVEILQQLFPNGHPDLDLYKRNLKAIKKSIKGISS